MSNQSIDNALITQFSDMVHINAQQMNARLRKWCEVEPKKGDVWSYDGLGPVEAREITQRSAPVVFADIEHTRRKIRRRRFEVTLPIDASDVRGALLDPSQKYPKAISAAMDRVFDRIALGVAFSDVQTGREFDTTLTFAQDGGLTVNATGGFTYEKLLEVNKNFTDGEVGNDIPVEKFITVSGDEEEDMMLETELVSGDFNRQYSIEKGQMVMAVGNNIIKYGASVSNPMLTESGGERFGMAATKGAIHVGISKEVQLKVQDRSDLIETTQVQAIFELGAVRTEGKLVQKIRFTA